MLLATALLLFFLAVLIRRLFRRKPGDGAEPENKTGMSGRPENSFEDDSEDKLSSSSDDELKVEKYYN